MKCNFDDGIEAKIEDSLSDLLCKNCLSEGGCMGDSDKCGLDELVSRMTYHLKEYEGGKDE